MTRIRAILPAGLVCYKATPEFNRDSVPQALLAAHNVKAGVWGLPRVLRGRIRYCLDDGTRETLTVEPGGAAVIEPEVRHHVELLDVDSAFRVEFHREQGGA